MEINFFQSTEHLNSDFKKAVSNWKNHDSIETASKINELIEKGGGDYADFLLRLSGDVLEHANGGFGMLHELLTEYGRKEDDLWVLDIHGHKRLGIKILVLQEPRLLILKHKGEGPLYYFKSEEIAGIEVV